MTRNEFLEKTWKPYPVLPSGDFFVGRVREITKTSSGVSVCLARHGLTETRYFQKFCFVENSEHSHTEASANPFGILHAEDLVAVSDDGVVVLLAPALNALPQRNFRPDRLKLWQDYVYWLRQFFREQSFLEIETPTLVACPGTEPTLDYFRTVLQQGSHKETYYLPTSPELHLKKALALGTEKIFEIRRCFRNGEITAHHQPEFTMIEWYRAYAGLGSIQKDVIELVQYLVTKIPELRKPTAVELSTVSALFKKHCNFELTPGTSKAELKALAEFLGVDVSSAQEIDDFFFLIFMEKIESAFPAEQMTFVKDYPPYQAALARIGSCGWGQRFEMYWQGLEIANAFHELNDPEVQAARFIEDLEKKRSLGKEIIPLDDEFMQCLRAGMPPASGIALGVERLFMALTGIQEIDQTRLFPMKV